MRCFEEFKSCDEIESLSNMKQYLEQNKNIEKPNFKFDLQKDDDMILE